MMKKKELYFTIYCQKKIIYIPDVNHGIYILLHVLILSLLSYNKISEF
jgi:hypothetical protein